MVSSGLRRTSAFDRKETAKPLRTVHFTGLTPYNVYASAGGPLFSAGMIDDEPVCGGQPKADENGAVSLLACARSFMVASVDANAMKVLHTVRAGPHLPVMGASSAMPVTAKSVWAVSIRAAPRSIPDPVTGLPRSSKSMHTAYDMLTDPKKPDSHGPFSQALHDGRAPRSRRAARSRRRRSGTATC